MPRALSRNATESLKLLGLEITEARRARRMTATELCERASTTPFTLRRVEKGDPGVAIGTVFELATIVGVPLFGAEDLTTMSSLTAIVQDRLALLPSRIRESDEADDDDF